MDTRIDRVAQGQNVVRPTVDAASATPRQDSWYEASLLPLEHPKIGKVWCAVNASVAAVVWSMQSSWSWKWQTTVSVAFATLLALYAVVTFAFIVYRTGALHRVGRTSETAASDAAKLRAAAEEVKTLGERTDTIKSDLESARNKAADAARALAAATIKHENDVESLKANAATAIAAARIAHLLDWTPDRVAATTSFYVTSIGVEDDGVGMILRLYMRVTSAAPVGVAFRLHATTLSLIRHDDATFGWNNAREIEIPTMEFEVDSPKSIVDRAIRIGSLDASRLREHLRGASSVLITIGRPPRRLRGDVRIDAGAWSEIDIDPDGWSVVVPKHVAYPAE